VSGPACYATARSATGTGPCLRCGQPCPRYADGRRGTCPGCDEVAGQIIAAVRAGRPMPAAFGQEHVPAGETPAARPAEAGGEEPEQLW
jgi:hypothetical protein